MKIQFTPIQEPYLYGYEASVNGYRVQVVRCYQGEWDVIADRNGALIPSQPLRCRYPKAMAHARKLIREYQGQEVADEWTLELYNIGVVDKEILPVNDYARDEDYERAKREGFFYVAVISDHGNVELFDLDGNSVWSLV
jgi:hypothetical protein